MCDWLIFALILMFCILFTKAMQTIHRKYTHMRKAGCVPRWLHELETLRCYAADENPPTPTSKEIPKDKLIIIIDQDRVPNDRIVWMADAIYTLSGDFEEFTITKNRFIEKDVPKIFHLSDLPKLIKQKTYMKMSELDYGLDIRPLDERYQNET